MTPWQLPRLGVGFHPEPARIVHRALRLTEGRKRAVHRAAPLGVFVVAALLLPVIGLLLRLAELAQEFRLAALPQGRGKAGVAAGAIGAGLHDLQRLHAARGFADGILTG